MLIEALSKALSFYDMHDVFQAIPVQALDQLQTQLKTAFECQESLALCATYLQNDPANATLIQDEETAAILSSKAVEDLNLIDIFTSELLKYFKTINVTIIRQSNAHYAQYGAGHTVENLSWSGDHILDTCEEPLRKKSRGVDWCVSAGIGRIPRIQTND